MSQIHIEWAGMTAWLEGGNWHGNDPDFVELLEAMSKRLWPGPAHPWPALRLAELVVAELPNAEITLVVGKPPDIDPDVEYSPSKRF